MSRYLVIWQSNPSQMPADQTEMAKIISNAREWVNQDIKKGMITSWGAYMTQGKGYAVFEGNAPEVYKELVKSAPYFTYEINEVLSIDELPDT